MVTFGSVKEREYTLIEQGEYVLTLSEIDESEGNWGTRLVWKFLVADKADPTAYICNQNGDERTVWAFTDPDILLGSLQHEFMEKLTGKTFGMGDDLPDEDDLLGRRVLGYITHHTPAKGKNAGKKQEQIVAGSIKPFKGPQPNAVRRLDPKAATPEPTADEQAHATAKAKVESLIGRSVKLGTPHHLDYVAVDLDTASTDDLLLLASTISDEVMAALDA